MDNCTVTSVDAQRSQKMILWLRQQLFSLQIKVLLVVKPEVLFHKINQLEWYRNTLHQWINAHNFNSKIKILEVGCATGTLSGYLAELGYKTTAVDASRKMISLASSNNPGVNFYTADVTCLPFTDGEFDAVVSASLINIVSNQQAAINEMTRVCKNGGVISVLFPAHNFSNENLRTLEDAIKISGFSAAALKIWHKSAPKMHNYTARTLLHKAGLLSQPPVSYLQGMVSSMTATKSKSICPDVRREYLKKSSPTPFISGDK